MSSPFADILWAPAELPLLIEALAGKSGIPCRESPGLAGPGPEMAPGAWVGYACGRLGIDCEAVDLWGVVAEERLRAAAPALVPAGEGWLGLLAVRGRHAFLLTPRLSVHRIRFAELRALVTGEIEEKYRVEVDEFLRVSALAGKRREVAGQALRRERARQDNAGALFQLRIPPGAGFVLQAQRAGLFRILAGFAFAHLAEYGLWLTSWWILGRDALQGRADPGWLAAWVLTLAALVPFRMLTVWWRGRLSIAGGGLLRQRLLAGALRLSPEESRTSGVGRLLAQSIETEALETLALSGGLTAAIALLELGLAAVVLVLGAGGWPHAAALAVWTLAALELARRFWRRRDRWTASRLQLTQDLVEQMNGHRTRLAQQPSRDWHKEEDRTMASYEAHSRKMDATASALMGLIPGGWMVVGIAALAPAFLGENTPASLAVSIGGVLLAWRALRRLAIGAGQLAGAAISWKQVAELFRAASREEQAGLASTPPEGGEVVLEGRNLRFHREQTGRVVLQDAGFELRRGDRVLLEGESGGGKSTLVSLMAGLRDPSSGLLLSAGLDRRTMGDSNWRRRIVAAPQYHENHVMTGTLAYNLLMGARWPARPEDLKRAEEVCIELGLGPLLARMPGGLMQMVGETGWQLSQGERSRVFMARALLQSPEVVILDESFAALDPETARQAMECAFSRANALVAVAHP